MRKEMKKGGGKKRKEGGGERTHAYIYTDTEARERSGAGGEADARQLRVVEGSRALILNPG